MNAILDKNIQNYVELAYVYAPYFFSIMLFSMIIHAAMLHRKALKENILTIEIRVYFIVSVFAFFFVTGFGIIYWSYDPPRKHVRIFTGKITNVKNIELLSSEKIYFRSEYLPPTRIVAVDSKEPEEDELNDKDRINRHEHFLIIKDGPFRERENFDIDYYKSGKKVAILTLEHLSENYLKYRIHYDSDEQKHYIEPVDHSSGILVIHSAFAQQKPELPLNLQSLDISTEPLRIENEINDAVKFLQNERTGTVRKIEFLNRISRSDRSTVKRIIGRVTEKEPMFLTLLDLSRHTDEQISGIAMSLINQFDYIPYIQRLFRSNDEKGRETALSVLSGFDDNQREQVLMATGLQNEYIRSRHLSRTLFPTGSMQGDRYYVKATWNSSFEKGSSGEGIFECLTHLFNEQLISNRNKEEERNIMKLRNGARYVYWYSKDWALFIADRIRNCGGNATFVNGIDFKPTRVFR
ncbi:MAG: hypothetical protein OXH59_01225 [Rhodospirillaceae bacterium]|nr:hypothetical protein [Rhodospirillaceae bacterium]